MNCSPPGFFKTQPKMKQIWKWIKQLLTDYMKMKMNKNTSPLDVKTLYDLMELFNLDIQTQKRLIPTAETLIRQNSLMSKIIENTKIILNVK